jgi:EmrB/QacA subfamily drug resistance transporter
MLVASLDQTVVGTSLPRIVSEMGGMSLFSWLFTAYMLAETIVIPIAGKMSDRLGRKRVFLAGMGLFLLGSLLAGLATSMEELIACRFLQGLGGGALIPMAMAAVADLNPPEERGKSQGLMGAMFALGSVIGPFLGGFIVDNLDWRWVFFVNIPIGLMAVAVAVLCYPKVARAPARPLDYRGMALLSASLTAALLVMTWGGTTYAWDSVEIVTLGILSVTLLLGFVAVERRAADPIIPLHLFRERVFSLGSVGLMLLSMGLFGVIAFLPLFLQAVIGMSATSSGETLIPLMAGLVLTIMVSGLLLRRTGCRPWLLVGPPLTALGLVLLSTLHPGSTQLEAVAFLVLAGAGMGAVFSNYVVAAQNVMDRKETGVVTSTMSLFRSLGGAIGVTIMGSILNSRMAVELADRLPAGAAAFLPAMDATGMGGLLLSPQASMFPTEVLEALRWSLSSSITYLMALGALIAIGAFVASILMRRVPVESEVLEKAGAMESD